MTDDLKSNFLSGADPEGNMGDNALSANDLTPALEADEQVKKPTPLTEDSLVASHPGIAMVLDFSGLPKAVSAKGRDLRDALMAGQAKDIQQLIKEVIKKRKPLTGSVTVQLQGKKSDSSLELSLQPFPERETILLLGRDMSLERNLRNALVESRQRYKDLVEISSDFAWELDENGCFAFVSPRGALGFPAAEFIGKKPADFLLQPDVNGNVEAFAGSVSVQREVWMRSANRTPACLVVSNLPMITPEGAWIGARGVCRDITEDRLRDTALERAYQRERLLNQIVTAIRDEVEPLNMLNVAAAATAKGLDAIGCRIYRHFDYCGFDPAAEYGDCSNPETLSQKLEGLKADHDIAEVGIGGYRLLVGPTQYNGEINGAVALFRKNPGTLWADDDRLLLADIANQLGIANEQIANHEHIVKLSRTDSLTGLLNRRAFFEEDIPRRIRRLEYNKERAALIYIDLDNFKIVNDVFGHQQGDDALIALRDLLLVETRPGDAVARLGGDEFAVWMDGMTEENAANRVKRILAAGESLKQFSGQHRASLGMSIGVAIFDPQSGESMEELIARADGAMYDVKNNEKGHFAIAPPKK